VSPLRPDRPCPTAPLPVDAIVEDDRAAFPAQVPGTIRVGSVRPFSKEIAAYFDDFLNAVAGGPEPNTMALEGVIPSYATRESRSTQSSLRPTARVAPSSGSICDLVERQTKVTRSPSCRDFHVRPLFAIMTPYVAPRAWAGFPEIDYREARPAMTKSGHQPHRAQLKISSAGR